MMFKRCIYGMFGSKTGFLKNRRDLGPSDMDPDIFPGIVLIGLIEGPYIVGDEEYLMLMDVVLPVIKADDTLALYYKVKDYPVPDVVFI